VGSAGRAFCSDDSSADGGTGYSDMPVDSSCDAAAHGCCMMCVVHDLSVVCTIGLEMARSFVAWAAGREMSGVQARAHSM
jgi:hypothetical protein